MGLASPVSKFEPLLIYFISLLSISPYATNRRTAGNLFHQQLARQLSDFLEKPLAEKHVSFFSCILQNSLAHAIFHNRGGMMSLPDVYCLYNRARGTGWFMWFFVVVLLLLLTLLHLCRFDLSSRSIRSRDTHGAAQPAHCSPSLPEWCARPPTRQPIRRCPLCTHPFVIHSFIHLFIFINYSSHMLQEHLPRSTVT